MERYAIPIMNVNIPSIVMTDFFQNAFQSYAFSQAYAA